MRSPFIIVVAILFGLSLVLSLSARVFAQSSPSGIAYFAAITDKNVQDGSIISMLDNKFSLSTKAYDSLMVGVVEMRPAMLFDLSRVPAGAYPVVTTGNSFVLVSGQNGAIKKGDLITTSATKGIGMKATRSGYVLGYALEDFAPAKAGDVKKIGINLKMFLYTTEPAFGSNLWDVFQLSSIAAAEQPLRAFKYILAAIVLIISILLGFLSFGRMASRGVEALGRNPLASKVIQLGILLNLIVTIVIVGAGILVALFIVRL